MKIKAQIAMVMNLDKCLGCHTCSIPCKNVWTNRQGAEYIWYNNVETKPGIGYPKNWENQQLWKGGWSLGKKRPVLRSGGHTKKFAGIFHNPDLPLIDDYYEPWSYDYGKLIESPRRRRQPGVRPKSLITGENMRIKWGPNWEDDLAGADVTGREDVNFEGLEKEVYLQFQNVFMLHLPRICEHCLNPGCVASCPSGALYKRDEDGIVLVDQQRCRGWRYCVSGCPYKKVYYNWKSGRSEKCLFCYPRIEAGLPTLCAETCVGRIRYIGVMLYDADRVCEAAAAGGEKELYKAQTDLFLNPNDPAIASAAAAAGIASHMIDGAKNSPVYKLAVEWRLALPPHPEFRTLPMVWYIPPLSPIANLAGNAEGTHIVDRLRIPVRYLANLLAAGDEDTVRLALKKLMALRDYMRARRGAAAPESPGADALLEEVGLTPAMADEMYGLLALAKYRDRFVVPTVQKEEVGDLHRDRGMCGFPPGSQGMEDD